MKNMNIDKEIKQIYGAFLSFLEKLIGIDGTKNFDSFFRFGRTLNLSEPKSLADKVSYIELHTDATLRAKCTDKYEVRKFVKDRGLAEILVPIVMDARSSASEINFEDLPEEYVLKATHGCGMNIIHTNSEKKGFKSERKQVERWLSTVYGKYSLEPHYLLIKPRVYAEEYLGELNGLIDYKFHCYNGKPSFVLTVSERDTGLYKLNAYTCDWVPINCVIGKHKSTNDIPMPKRLKEMLNISRVLSAGFDFVRVDLYEVAGKVWFGELTFSPAACVFPYFTQDFLNHEGKKLVITA